MGIKGLWAVFTPFSEKKSMHEIRGQTLAVDLAGWVCDSQNVTDYHIQPKLYLRNLFFRTVFLLLTDINPIFVLEGEAPELKRDVMAARNAVQFRGAAPRLDALGSKRPDVARKRFRNVLKECESLLKCMGVICIKGRGEAEATCALMNAQNLVEAVVSQDSDCFAYGARRVYRNFSVSNAAGGGALHGSVDCYDADHMFQANGFGRNKMIALAMLCGCDYGAGACGSSITTVVSYLHTVPENEIINRLLSWVSDPHYYEEKARWVASKGRCERCGHAGRAHLRRGCPECASVTGCTDNGYKSKVSEVKRELSLRSRALSCGMPFPEPNVMEEFLNAETDKIDIASLKQPAPSLIQFVKLMTSKLDWTERYSVSKFLPLLTKWHLQDNVPSRTIKPVTIKKKRNPRGVPSYEVVWSDINGLYEALIPDEQFEESEDPSIVWTTTERQDLMRQYYPDVVEIYEESIKKPVKEKKSRSRKKNDVNADKPKRKYNKKVKNIDVNSLSDSLRNMSLKENESQLNKSKRNVSIKVNKLKRKIKDNKSKVQKTIDSYVKNKKRKSDKTLRKSLWSSYSNISIRNKKLSEFTEGINSDKENLASGKRDNNYPSTPDGTGDSDECDLSDIVDRIITREPDVRTAKINDLMFRLVYNKTTPRKCFRKSVLNNIQNNCSTPNESPNKRNVANVNRSCKVNTSYFFDKLTEEGDAFEISVDYKHKSAIIGCDDTVDYSLPQVCL